MLERSDDGGGKRRYFTFNDNFNKLLFTKVNLFEAALSAVLKKEKFLVLCKFLIVKYLCGPMIETVYKVVNEYSGGGGETSSFCCVFKPLYFHSLKVVL